MLGERTKSFLDTSVLSLAGDQDERRGQQNVKQTDIDLFNLSIKVSKFLDLSTYILISKR